LRPADATDENLFPLVAQRHPAHLAVRKRDDAEFDQRVRIARLGIGSPLDALVQRHQGVERTSYPKSGDPNPLVKLGIVSLADGKVRWVSLGDKREEILVSGVGWSQ